MKIMTTEFSSPHTACTPQQTRTEIMSDTFSDAGWHMWLFQNTGGIWSSQYQRSALTIAIKGPDGKPIIPGGGKSKNTQSVTFGVGKIVFHIFSTVVPDTEFKLPDNILDHMIPIYPVKGDFVSPLKFSFGDDAINTISMFLHNASATMNWAPMQGE